MNTKEALSILMEVFHGFRLHERFISELSALLKKELKGKESRFFKVLITQLNNIREFGTKVDRVDDNEIIHSKYGRFYSIHLQQSQFNIRFLVYIFEDGTPYFLSAFYERAGKKVTDYTKSISVLARRLKEMEDDGQDD